MPIRFRCAYCNQLMGIARRKAGSVVRCPNCAGQVIVPDPGPERPMPAAQANSGQPQPLFEGSDFDKIFEPNTVGAPPAPNPGPVPQPAAYAGPTASAGYDVEALTFPQHGPGIFFTPAKLTISSIVVVILLGLAFLAGLLVGRS